MMGTRQRQYCPQLVILGALGVGKSALTVKYLTKRFIMEYDPFLEDTYTKEETLEGLDILVRIMDTYEKEPGSDCERYFQWADALMVVYSITNRSTFDLAHDYLSAIGQYQRLHAKDLPVILVGNKMDLERYRTVSKVAGENLASQFDCLFAESSAAEDLESVESIFQRVLKDVLREHTVHLQPLYISESAAASARSHDKKDYPVKIVPKRIPSRTPSTFKIFNKSFKIFN